MPGFDFDFKMRFLILFAVALMAVHSSSVSATSIVLARTSNEIVIGADSKVTDTFGNDLNKRACKIWQIDDLFIAIEGLELDRRTGFSVLEISHQALSLRPFAPASERVSILMGFLVTGLLAELSHLKAHEPQTFFKKIEGGQLFLRVIVAGFENRRPLVFVRSFRALQYNPGQIGVAVIPDDCLADCKSVIATRFLGESDAIEGLPEETPDFWKSGLSDGVRRLIEIEIEARSEYVGPPIDIVRITANGAQWVQKKTECSDLRFPAKSRKP